MSMPHFTPRPAPHFFKTEETVAIALRAHEQDIVRIENLSRTPERPVLRRRLLRLVVARVDSVAVQLKRKCKHFVTMFVTIMLTDKGARHAGQRRKRLQKSLIGLLGLSSCYQTTGGAHE
jgi:hypothetical protein